MSRLPTLRPREVIRALRRAGFSIARRTASDFILAKPGHTVPICVPCRPRDIKRGALRRIIRAAGLDREEFLRLLR